MVQFHLSFQITHVQKMYLSIGAECLVSVQNVHVPCNCVNYWKFDEPVYKRRLPEVSLIASMISTVFMALSIKFSSSVAIHFFFSNYFFSSSLIFIQKLSVVRFLLVQIGQEC